MVNITPYDISLVKQKEQKRYAVLRIVNREKRNVCLIRGEYISGGVDIDESSNIRRTGNVTMKVRESDIENLAHLAMNYYVRLYVGIEDNNTLEVSWYKQGTFIITQNSVKFDKATRTLSLSLADLMTDLTGDRAGVLHAFSSIAKNSQRIDTVMKNVLEICGVTDYDITPICVTRKSFNFWDEKQSEKDFLVPYDLEFSTGFTAYDILDKLINLYPNWEMFFDLDGKFICQRKVTEEDNSFVVMDDDNLQGLIISEGVSIDWSKVNWDEFTTGDASLDEFMKFATTQGWIQKETGQVGLCYFTTTFSFPSRHSSSRSILGAALQRVPRRAPVSAKNSVALPSPGNMFRIARTLG